MSRSIEPIVRRRARERTGRGFSIPELAEAGLNTGEARQLGVPVDQRRGTSHKVNIETLKNLVKETKKTKRKASVLKKGTKKE